VRILYLVNSLEVGGVEVLVTRMIAWIKAKGHSPSVICLDRLGAISQGLLQSGIPVCSLNRPPTLSLQTAWLLAQQLRTEKYDVLHTHNWGPFVYGVLSSCLTCSDRVRHVHTQHSVPDDFRKIRRLAGRVLGLGVDHWITVSEHVTDFLLQSKWCRDHRKLSKILNGVAIREEGAGLEGPHEQEGITEASIVCVGRLVEVKDHRTLLIAFKRVIEKGKRAILILVGDGPLRNELEALSQQLGIANAVRFVGYRSDVQEILQRGTVFVLSSLSEGNSVALLEAMAAGLPVVATDVGGNSEILEHEKTGLLVPPADPNALSDAILRVLDDPRLSKSLSQAAMNAVRQRYSFDAMMASYLRIYQGVRGRK